MSLNWKEIKEISNIKWLRLEGQKGLAYWELLATTNPFSYRWKYPHYPTESTLEPDSPYLGRPGESFIDWANRVCAALRNPGLGGWTLVEVEYYQEPEQLEFDLDV